jgi:hypothetical protein
VSKIPLAGLLFLIFNPIVSQFNKAAFEKNYLEFHEKWEAGYDCSLKEIETLFDQCPDLSQYPHYYLYKGDLLSSKGYSDLALKYYLLGEKYYITAESFGQTTIGMYNTTLAGSTTVFDVNDRLFVIGNGESVTKESDALVILKNGDTTLNGALTVSGTISTVASGTLHPDYVFERYYEGVSEYNKSYSLPSLSEIEVFVKANKHLPGVQSRSDIKEKGSWNITENVRTNLEKVEELYLYAIAQQKKIDAQSKVIEQLILRLDALEKKE